MTDKKSHVVEKFPQSSTTKLLGLVTTKECYQARTIQSIQFIYASKDSEVCDKLDLINRKFYQVSQLPLVDHFCTKDELVHISQTPYISNYEDRSLSP